VSNDHDEPVGPAPLHNQTSSPEEILIDEEVQERPRKCTGELVAPARETNLMRLEGLTAADCVEASSASNTVNNYSSRPGKATNYLRVCLIRLDTCGASDCDSV